MPHTLRASPALICLTLLGCTVIGGGCGSGRTTVADVPLHNNVDNVVPLRTDVNLLENINVPTSGWRGTYQQKLWKVEAKAADPDRVRFMGCKVFEGLEGLWVEHRRFSAGTFDAPHVHDWTVGGELFIVAMHRGDDGVWRAIEALNGHSNWRYSDSKAAWVCSWIDAPCSIQLIAQ